MTEASLLLAVFFLGTNFVAVKYAVGGFPPLPFVALRFTLAGLLLLGLLRILSPKSWPGRRDLVFMAGVGVVGVGMNNVAFTIGVSLTTASETALIYAAVPIWGMILGSMFGLERPTRGGIVGVVVAIVGVGVVVGEGFGGGGESSLLGDLLVVVATVCWGSYAVLSLPLLRRYPPLVVASLTMLFAGLATMPVAVPGLWGTDWGEVGAGAWVAFAYSTVLVAAFGFWAWQWGFSGVGGQPGFGIPVPDKPGRSRLGCVAAWGESHSNQDPRWGRHPPRSVPGPAALANLVSDRGLTVTVTVTRANVGEYPETHNR